MDKLTVFDILAFLIPGAFLNGLIYYFLLLNRVDLSIFQIPNSTILNSVAYLGISYIVGFVISELAFHTIEKFHKAKKNIDTGTLNPVAILTQKFDDDYLSKLSEFNNKLLKLPLVTEEKEYLKANMNSSFFHWTEILSMNTKYGLSTVLHAQFMLFRNLWMACLILFIPILVTIIHYALCLPALPANFWVITSLIVLSSYLFFFICVKRYTIYTQTVVMAIYVYFSTQPKTQNDKDL